MLFKWRKKLFEVVCYEEGKEGISIDEKSRCADGRSAGPMTAAEFRARLAAANREERKAVIVQAMLDPSLSAEAFSLVLEEDAEKNRERWVEHVCEQK